VGWRRCVHDMHGPNRLNDARLTSPRAPAQVAAVSHGSILREASSALSLCSYIFQELMNRGKYAYMVFAFLNSTRAVKNFLSFFLSFLGFADPT